MDFCAASFVRKAEDVFAVRDLIAKYQAELWCVTCCLPCAPAVIVWSEERHARILCAAGRRPDPRTHRCRSSARSRMLRQWTISMLVRKNSVHL